MAGKIASKDAWMPLYIGAYLRKTARLTTEQHGAYLLLIMDYWVNGPLPDDEAALAQVAKLDPRKWKAMSATIRAFFVEQDGKLVHDRIERELETAGRIIEKRSEAGRAGAQARWGKRDGIGNGNANGKQHSKPIANGMAKRWQTGSQNDAPSPSPSQMENTEHTPSLDAARPSLAADAALWVRIIRAFDEARDAAFPAQPRAYPAQNDRTFAEKFVELGADLELCRDAFSAACQRFKAESREPPSGLVYFKQIIPDALRARKSPLPAARGRTGAEAPLRTLSPSDADEIERINARFIAGGSYQADVSLSQVKAMIGKGLLTRDEARKAGYAA